MSILVTHEHTRLQVGDQFSLTPPLLGESQFAELARVNLFFRRAGKSEPFELGYLSVRTKQYVGVVSFGQHTLEILPKLDQEQNGIGRRQLIQMLIKMLAFARKLPLVPGPLTALDTQKVSFIEVYFGLFLRELHQQRSRGALFQYRSVTETLPVYRGKLQWPQQIRSGKQFPFHCLYEEWTADHSFNFTFKRALEKIKPHIRLSENYHLCTRLLHEFDQTNANIQEPLPTEVRPPQWNRQTSRYQTVWELAQLFLNHSQPHPIRSGSKIQRRPTFSILFDMNLLFEEYIALNLKKMAPHRVFVQQAESYLAIDSQKRHHFKMRPDILIKNQDSFQTVIDTKWKPLSHRSPHSGVLSADIYQILTYGRQYGCKELVLIYPSNSGKSGFLNEYHIKNSDEKIRIFGFNLYQLEKTTEQLQPLLD